MLDHDGQSGFSRRRLNLLGAMCTALLIELTVAAGLALRALTGQNWPLSSLAVAFFLVCPLHPRLERWIWGTVSC